MLIKFLWIFEPPDLSYFQFVESYPLTASGKVQKFVLREQAIKVLGLEQVAKTKTA
ncbi:hypothetical protein KSZ_14580 [Dictyobacter formicarum]|uniref:AMP-binding enzyme C-terminal domain-containing protein n=2 Tax=Dictyobacter formicarum TaxID=2778368 RepID=A0ABQ3VC25_9CHLR|nr:hypothetical protein KSZ_14580 [Dictyobacter formicarum]